MPASDADLLGVLEHAIAVVDRDGRIAFANAAWQRMQDGGECAGRDLFACFPVLAQPSASGAIAATRADGLVRHTHIAGPGGSAGVEFGLRVARTGDGRLVLELLPARDAPATGSALEQREVEHAALRSLARQMAEVADTVRLFGILCETASLQCSATGAIVIRSSNGAGEIVAATGILAPARENRFPLDNSLAREVIDSRSTVAIDDFSRTTRPLARQFGELDVGPMLLAPLLAHDAVLGVIAVVRDRKRPAFTGWDAQRLQIVADHAALALWKADLLEQAQAADHAKGRFLATVSHELRTPLTALAGYEELLADQVLGPLQDSQRDVLERMRAVTQHLTVMIEEVLTYSSIEAGRETVRTTEFLAADLLRSVGAIVEPLARQKRLRLQVELPHTPVRLTSDVDKIRQILVNLAGNAVKFTAAGDIRLAVHPAEGEVRFAIQDTGIGIPAADFPRLFRPFTQLDTGLTRRHGGTGLGLYISQRLATLLGGRIEVQSAVGRGSLFTLILPTQDSGG